MDLQKNIFSLILFCFLKCLIHLSYQALFLQNLFVHQCLLKVISYEKVFAFKRNFPKKIFQVFWLCILTQKFLIYLNLSFF